MSLREVEEGKNLTFLFKCNKKEYEIVIKNNGKYLQIRNPCLKDRKEFEVYFESIINLQEKTRQLPTTYFLWP